MDKEHLVRAMILRAQALAGPMVAELIARTENGGPSLALLTLYVARAETARIAQSHLTAEQWSRFIRHEAELERMFEQHCEVLREMSKDLIVLAGKPS